MTNSNSKKKIEVWEQIDWSKTERYVFKLQKRIYDASNQGNFRKVRKLQRTLINSWSNKVLAVRRVTQDNRGKKTAGVDGIKSLSPKARIRLAGQLKLTGKSKPTLRVWIPKPGKEEKRPLGIPTMYDRALQGVVKAALEPEWEALFEPSSYGFRPGRSCHDAISHIKKVILSKAKYVLDADISKCFDKIDHEALIFKIGQKGIVNRQIKAWLKSGVIDLRKYAKTESGTPQGGVISPLLANIALHGLEQKIKEFAKTIDVKRPNGYQLPARDKVSMMTFIRYADDFVLIHPNKEAIKRGKTIISEWLKDVGLELKPEKTRLTHTLINEESEDGQAGFDFLGFHIQQFPAGKYKSSKNPHQEILGFNTLITPTKEAGKKHQTKLKEVIRIHSSTASQSVLIGKLNPIIRGWSNYYRHSDIKTTGESSRQDNLTYIKLRSWGRRRCKGNLNAAHKKYWHKIDKQNWVFSSREGESNFHLLRHDKFNCSSNEYVKVKGNASPYNGNLVYWSTRMGRHPEVDGLKSNLLKKQKGKCPYCNLFFRDSDIKEADHIIAKKLNGKNVYSNYQLLHGHCHDKKTALDLIKIQEIKSSKTLERIFQEYENLKFQWINDIPVILN